VLVIGLIIALGAAGVNVGAALALIGGGAFILAFALQDTLGNFANGLMLLIYRPFDVGDAVEVGGVSGSVHEVSLVNTTILTFDNKKVIVPNKNVWGQVITNITGMPTRRVDMTFGIGYDDDSDKALAILKKVVTEHELVLEEPAPAVRINELADSSVNFICRPWSKTGDYWTVFSEITDRVKKEFDAAGISIPYPQQDVHMHTVAAKSDKNAA
jgi:small conductance mechanosensitive channel